MKTSGGSWQFYRNEPALNNNGKIIYFPNYSNSISLKFKQQITGQIGKSGTKDVEILIPLKYVSNFSRTTEISLINCDSVLN